MRTIVDADRLPTAVRYYNRIRKEPAQTAKNDIQVDPLDAVRELTLESLLNKLADHTSAGEKEFMVVLHSGPNGLILPVGGGVAANITADKTVLGFLRLASEAFANLADSKNPDMAVNQAFLDAWMDFFSHTPEVNTGAINQASDVAAKCAEAAKLCQLWVKALCDRLRIQETALRRLAALVDRVSRSGINRLEFRSCRLGAGAGLKEVAHFFGAMSFAPTVRTFYVHQPVQIVANQARLNQMARGLGANSRRFTTTNAAAGTNDDVGFAIQVSRVGEGIYTSRMFALSDMVAWNWLAAYIWTMMPFFMPANLAANQVKAGGFPVEFVVSGFWTPDLVNKPFIFPQEPEYRGFIEGVF